MSIIRVKKDRNNPYLIMNKTGLNDKRLSLRAKGLLCYLLSKPDNWYVNTKEIVSFSSDGIKSIWSTIKELVKFGYIYKHQFRNDNGQFHSYNYLVFECPKTSTSSESNSQPNCPSGSSVKPSSDKDTLLINKTKINNKTFLTTSSNKSNNYSVVQEDLNLKKLKHETKLLLYELGIKDYQKLFNMFDISDIFDYVDWMMPFKSSIKNRMGFLITALNEKWADPESFKKSRMP